MEFGMEVETYKPEEYTSSVIGFHNHTRKSLLTVRSVEQSEGHKLSISSEYGLVALCQRGCVIFFPTSVLHKYVQEFWKFTKKSQQINFDDSPRNIYQAIDFDSANFVQFFRDGRYVFIGSDKKIAVYSVTNLKTPLMIAKTTSYVQSFDYNKFSDEILIVFRKKLTHIYSVKEKFKLKREFLKNSGYNSASFSPAGKSLVFSQKKYLFFVDENFKVQHIHTIKEIAMIHNVRWVHRNLIIFDATFEEKNINITNNIVSNGESSPTSDDDVTSFGNGTKGSVRELCLYDVQAEIVIRQNDTLLGEIDKQERRMFFVEYLEQYKLFVLGVSNSSSDCLAFFEYKNGKFVHVKVKEEYKLVLPGSFEENYCMGMAVDYSFKPLVANELGKAGYERKKFRSGYRRPLVVMLGSNCSLVIGSLVNTVVRANYPSPKIRRISNERFIDDADGDDDDDEVDIDEDTNLVVELAEDFKFKKEAEVKARREFEEKMEKKKKKAFVMNMKRNVKLPPPEEEKQSFGPNEFVVIPTQTTPDIYQAKLKNDRIVRWSKLGHDARFKDMKITFKNGKEFQFYHFLLLGKKKIGSADLYPQYLGAVQRTVRVVMEVNETKKTVKADLVDFFALKEAGIVVTKIYSVGGGAEDNKLEYLVEFADESSVALALKLNGSDFNGTTVEISSFHVGESRVRVDQVVEFDPSIIIPLLFDTDEDNGKRVEYHLEVFTMTQILEMNEYQVALMKEIAKIQSLDRLMKLFAVSYQKFEKVKMKEAKKSVLASIDDILKFANSKPKSGKENETISFWSVFNLNLFNIFKERFDELEKNHKYKRVLEYLSPGLYDKLQSFVPENIMEHPNLAWGLSRKAAIRNFRELYEKRLRDLFSFESGESFWDVEIVTSKTSEEGKAEEEEILRVNSLILLLESDYFYQKFYNADEQESLPTKWTEDVLSKKQLQIFIRFLFLKKIDVLELGSLEEYFKLLVVMNQYDEPLFTKLLTQRIIQWTNESLHDDKFIEQFGKVAHLLQYYSSTESTPFVFSVKDVPGSSNKQPSVTDGQREIFMKEWEPKFKSRDLVKKIVENSQEIKSLKEEKEKLSESVKEFENATKVDSVDEKKIWEEVDVFKQSLLESVQEKMSEIVDVMGKALFKEKMRLKIAKVQEIRDLKNRIAELEIEAVVSKKDEK